MLLTDLYQNIFYKGNFYKQIMTRSPKFQNFNLRNQNLKNKKTITYFFVCSFHLLRALLGNQTTIICFYLGIIIHFKNISYSII